MYGKPASCFTAYYRTPLTAACHCSNAPDLDPNCCSFASLAGLPAAASHCPPEPAWPSCKTGWSGNSASSAAKAISGSTGATTAAHASQPGLPCLSQAINAINHIGNADSERLQVLAEIILKDFSLTNKLLKVVNTANFSQFGGAVSTVSRAIVILGFDTIRNLALTLLLFEHMHNRSHAQEVRDVATKALFCGLLAATWPASRMQEAEEALICGMFQQLGELLCVYYFRNEYRLITKKSHRQQPGQAVQHTLGLSYATLGASTADSGAFRNALSAAWNPTARPGAPTNSSTARLRMLGNLARN
jgi:hypothetical protein